MGDNTNQQQLLLTPEDIRRMIVDALTDPGVRAQLRGPAGEQGRQGEPGQLARSDSSWKAADIGFFDPKINDKEGVQMIGNVSHYTNVEIFIDRMRDLALLKSEAVVRANIHSYLKGDALKWFSFELSPAEKRMMQSCPVEDGWYAMLQQRFKMDRTFALREMEKEKYGWKDVRAGRTPREYSQNMLRLLKSTGYNDVFDQLLKIRDNIEASLRRDITRPTRDTTIAEFMDAIDEHYLDWQSQVSEREQATRERSQAEKPTARPRPQDFSNRRQERRDVQRLPFRPLRPMPQSHQQLGMPESKDYNLGGSPPEHSLDI
ncbi:hypothetical protein N7462_008271 [Penicillium macrosclerotiorum]|uniref:uncharacterized protein n=1 Tax=Penicillium macrosclerotiorum TaxID=303699 RepID=UPI0025497E3F|nr:uncharacterized protein N7462_008271 [Penicillium macrosclerotiorum]KAJ5675374.1 hypothetical protein N7462_008271 [Penicillium macrosclerotiorum]